jgi:VWFA-related protein
VTDANGRSVPALQASDFHIYENNQEQKIARVIPENDPFYVVLMIDTSGSTHFKLAEMQSTAVAFIDSLRAQDRIMVVAFDDETYFGAGFSEDRDAARRSLAGVHAPGGTTRIYDAVNSVRLRLLSVPGRKVIVLFSDGVDNVSIEAGESETLKAIEQSDIVVYAVQYDTRKDGISNRFPVPPPPGYPSFSQLYGRAVKFLRNLTSRSGGLLLPADTIDGLRAAFAHIAQELPRQYTLCYYPSRIARAGEYCRLRVTVPRPSRRTIRRPRRWPTWQRCCARPAPATSWPTAMAALWLSRPRGACRSAGW